ncbi:protein of unknown function (plasmid) [Candidatus Methylocalor cossyra]|uniref:Mutator family transposase n=1 Tax=Candidatus Methylocalor cossyra TaxID=3108543 RepID=A0ABP1CD20_9GAMM
MAWLKHPGRRIARYSGPRRRTVWKRTGRRCWPSTISRPSNWIHLRTTYPIESTFATVRPRTTKTRGCVFRESILARVFMLAKSAERHWRKLNGIPCLVQVIEGTVFKDGVRDDAEKIAA